MKQVLIINTQTTTEKNADRNTSFLKGTLILTVAGIVVKVIGSLNWIFVSRVLGGEGIGLYQMAFPIYFLAFNISTAGVPIAISIITAEHIALKDIWGAKRIFHISMTLMFFTGILCSLLTYFGAQWLIDWQFIRDPRAYYAVIALAPAIFFVTILASSRGYLQGWQRMTPTGVSQIVEQIFRVITMILFAQLLLPYGLEFAAAGASLGALAGAVAGLLVLIYFHWQLNKDISRTYGDHLEPPPNEKRETVYYIMKRIFKLSLPVSATSIMLPIVANLDLMIVPQRLEVAGYSVNEATKLFGYLTGMAVPLVNLATILTAALAVSIVPAISKARTLKDYDSCFSQTAAAIRISNFICFPAFVIVLVLAVPIASLIYNAPGAGPAVWVSAFSIVLLGLHQITTAVLQGLGHPTVPMVNMIIAAIAKVILNWILTAQPSLGIMGAAWATAADIGIAAIINLYFLHRYIGYKMEVKQILKNMIAAAIMALALYFSYYVILLELGSSAVATLGAVLVGTVVYIAILIVVKGILEQDMAAIPVMGKFAIKGLRKIGVFKEISQE
ncbi:putative polysaccharide biosynthesis protein [Pectinatus cerevisiiphilus]|uniref:Stage V sporulation protein B n=1 Tax=Pectinatus cerevisiiphilus TaxID=86956 RepID=A0A4R3KFU1_9FIRM|nr:polysaccharide biosynthesis protein [Pectinatus cerevisiiphilus]TCS82015.1 stage V sporulation protein B [Pectinatus cerevisiiphilus]